jgi:hypothetical protein
MAVTNELYEIKNCDLCKRFAITSETYLVHPQLQSISYSDHYEFLKCEENTLMCCFSCRLKLKRKQFYYEVLYRIYKERGMDYIYKLQDLALKCNPKQMRSLFMFEENLRKIDKNRSAWKQEIIKFVKNSGRKDV